MGNGNAAGAKYGTGYCDAQCPHDIKFINGGANVLDWHSSPNDPNSGTGKWGTCCPEMDIWEANKISSAFTLHPCKTPSQHKCTSPEECGDSPTHRFDPSGHCDKDGCDLNPYRGGVTDFFGPGMKVDTSKPFTVVTQFHTTDKTANGDLSEVRRIFVQDGKKIEHPMTNVPGMKKQFDSITQEMCDTIKPAFGDTNDFTAKGGIKGMDEAF